jgi:hypothetical protein
VPTVRTISQLHLIYFPYFPQDQWLNLTLLCCQELKKRGFKSVQLVDPWQWQVISPFQFWSLQWLRFSRRQIGDQRFFWEIIPFRRFDLVNKMNWVINLFIFSFSELWRRKGEPVIVISSYFQFPHSAFFRILNPALLIADMFDYVSPEEVLAKNKLANITVTTPELNKLHSKFGPTKIISAGYFTHQQLIHLRKNFTFKPRTVLFIGTIDYRTDFSLVKYCMDQLPNYQFRFYYVPMYEMRKKLMTPTLAKQNLKVKKDWLQIKKRPNFWGQVITNQEDLSHLNIQGSVGILPYDMKITFNKYCHPVKFYNYRAVGLHVVSVPLESIKKYHSDSVRFAENKLQFVKEIKKIPQTRPTKEEQLQGHKLAIAQSIEKRAEQLISIIKEELQKK